MKIVLVCHTCCGKSVLCKFCPTHRVHPIPIPAVNPAPIGLQFRPVTRPPRSRTPPPPLSRSTHQSRSRSFRVNPSQHHGDSPWHTPQQRATVKKATRSVPTIFIFLQSTGLRVLVSRHFPVCWPSPEVFSSCPVGQIHVS